MLRTALTLVLCALMGQHAIATADDDEDLLFLFQDVFEEVFAMDAAMDEPLLNYRLIPSGYARYDCSGLMVLTRGQFQAPNQNHLAQLLRKGQQFTLELVLRSQGAQDARVLTLGQGLNLQQKSNQLILNLATSKGTQQLVATPAAAEYHLILCLRDGELAMYLDGKLSATLKLADTQATWPDFAASFGSGSNSKPGWQGSIGHLGLYEQGFDAARAESHYKQSLSLLQEPPKPFEISGKLIAISKAATPAEIEPYPASLAVYEYELITQHAGYTWEKRVRVAHWVVLGHQALPAAQARIGDVHRMKLELFSANRQLATTHRTETLPPDAKVQLYLATEILPEWKN